MVIIIYTVSYAGSLLLVASNIARYRFWIVSFPDPGLGTRLCCLKLDPLHLHHVSVAFLYTKVCAAILVYHNTLALYAVSIKMCPLATTGEHL